jgi:LPS-assembly protein
MARCNRLVITLLALVLVTSGARAQLVTFPTAPAQAASQLPPPQLPLAHQREAADIKADHWEKKGDLYTLRGNADVRFRGWTITADEMTYDEASGDVNATGHVDITGGPHDEHIQATHGLYNVNSETGRFENVTGTTGMRIRSGRMVLTSPNPFVFRGERVEKTSADRFVVYKGYITVCEMPHPAWGFGARRAVVEVGDEAQVYHATFHLGGVPLLYLPWVARPMTPLGRTTGFLLPTGGVSSSKGTTIGESFFWAINRSMDTTLGAEYFSRRGWAEHGQFRMRPTENAFLEARYFGVLDRGLPSTTVTSTGATVPTRVDQGGEEVTVTSEARLPYGVRAVGDIDYLSSFLFRQAFYENFALAVNSEVRSNVFASKSVRGFSFNGDFARYQNFESVTPGDVVTIAHVPSFESSGVEQQLGKLPLVWSYESTIDGVSRSNPGFVTHTVGRIDLEPRLALPLVVQGWSVRPEIGLRNTFYTRRLLPSSSSSIAVGTPLDSNVNRRALEATFELRPPALARAFDHEVFGRKLKHVIEPRAVYRYVNGVDNFQNILRFDARDILSNTNEFEYALVQRLYAKRTRDAGDCTPPPPPPQAAMKHAEPGTTASPAPTQEAESQPQAQPQSTQEASPATGNPFGTPAPGSAEVRSEDRFGRDNIPEPAIKTPCEPAGSVREFLTWEVAQKAFLDPEFGGAIVAGRRNVLTTSADFTGIAFLTAPRNLSPIISRLRARPNQNTDVQWNLDYDQRQGRINASTAILSWRTGEWFFGGSHALLRDPGEIIVSSGSTVAAPERFNQFRLLAGYGHPNKRGLSFAGNIGFDANLNFLQYAVGQTSYNWDCIGVSVEYRRLALGAVRNENQFRFSLSLANIGTFGTLRRQERLF